MIRNLLIHGDNLLGLKALENVQGLLTKGGLRVVEEITKLGYDCRWCTIPASAIGALHQRKRWFMLAHTKHDGASSNSHGNRSRKSPEKRRSRHPQKDIRDTARAGCISDNVANSESDESPRQQFREKKTLAFPGMYGQLKDSGAWQKAVSEMGKLTDGISHHVDRLRVLGNAVVPAQAKAAFEILAGLERTDEIKTV